MEIIKIGPPEAKSRHRAGVLGSPGVPKPLSEIEADVFRLLQSALLKKADYDRIIFIDVNVPPNGIISLETQWLNKVVEQIARLEERQTPDNPWAPAFIVFTNHPYHYVGSDQPVPEAAVVFSSINMPHLKLPDPAYSSKYPAFTQLCYSVLNHTAIPQDFQSINTPAHLLLNPPYPSLFQSCGPCDLDETIRVRGAQL